MTMRTKYLSAIVLVLLVCAGSGYAEESQVIIKDGDKVAYLGDSITAAGGNYGGYCRLVVHGLKMKDIFVEPVLAGVPGNTSEHMLGRLVSPADGRDEQWTGDGHVRNNCQLQEEDDRKRCVGWLSGKGET